MDEKLIFSRLSRIGIFGNILLAAFKLISGIFGKSGAMVSDAVHSLSDVFATVIAWIGVRLSRRKEDTEHPYGHERLECVAAIVLAGALLSFSILGRDLDLLSFGDQEAQSMGVSVKRTRTLSVLATSLLVAAAVSVSGIIGFVSLIIPHIMRLLAGPKNRRLLPLAFFGGAIFMILCDLISRTAVPPTEIAVGAITQVTGAPFFLYLLWKERRKGEQS